MFDCYCTSCRVLRYLGALAGGEPCLVVPFLQRGVAVRLEGTEALCHEVWILRCLQLPLGCSVSTYGPLFFLIAVFLLFTLITIDLLIII